MSKVIHVISYVLIPVSLLIIIANVLSGMALWSICGLVIFVIGIVGTLPNTFEDGKMSNYWTHSYATHSHGRTIYVNRRVWITTGLFAIYFAVTAILGWTQSGLMQVTTVTSVVLCILSIVATPYLWWRWWRLDGLD